MRLHLPPWWRDPVSALSVDSGTTRSIRPTLRQAGGTPHVMIPWFESSRLANCSMLPPPPRVNVTWGGEFLTGLLVLAASTPPGQCHMEGEFSTGLLVLAASTPPGQHHMEGEFWTQAESGIKQSDAHTCMHP